MVKKCAYFKGFTLAEVMIVLTVIGVLTAILLPVARQSMPDENLMKFKKAHNTLGTVIRELVTNNKYCLDGDLGKMPNGKLVDNPTYFCRIFSDVLNAKKVDCSTVDNGKNYSHVHPSYRNDVDNTNQKKIDLDNYCKKFPNVEIVSQDDVVYYSVTPHYHFAIHWNDDYPDVRLFGNPGAWGDYYYYDESGNLISSEQKYNFDVIYYSFCMDIDGIPENATENDCVNECPFGYGIRADGKILTGARADEWLAREINQD